MPATHWATSGETKVLPAPEIVVACCEAREAPAVPTAVAASSAAAAARAEIRIKEPSFGIWLSPRSWIRGQRTKSGARGGIRACAGVVTKWWHALRFGLLSRVRCRSHGDRRSPGPDRGRAPERG